MALDTGRKLSRPTMVFITAKKVVSGRRNLFRRLLFLQFQSCAAVEGDLIIYQAGAPSVSNKTRRKKNMQKWQAGAVVQCSLGGESQQLSAASFPSLLFCIFLMRSECLGRDERYCTFPSPFLFSTKNMDHYLCPECCLENELQESTLHSYSPGKPSSNLFKPMQHSVQQPPAQVQSCFYR